MVRCPRLFDPGESDTVYKRYLLGLITEHHSRIKEAERPEGRRELPMVASLDIFDTFLLSTVTDQDPPELS